MAASLTLIDQIIFEPLTQWDDIVLQGLHSHNTPLGIQIVRTLTILGAGAFTTILEIGLAALFSLQNLCLAATVFLTLTFKWNSGG